MTISVETPSSGHLHGIWQLVSLTGKVPQTEQEIAPYGQKPDGYLIYTSAGFVMVQISRCSADRELLPISRKPSADEFAAAFMSSVSYSGRYTEADNQVTHYVEISTIPNWVGTTQVRQVEINGDLLVLTTPAMHRPDVDDMPYSIVWKRAG